MVVPNRKAVILVATALAVGFLIGREVGPRTNWAISAGNDDAAAEEGLRAIADASAKLPTFIFDSPDAATQGAAETCTTSISHVFPSKSFSPFMSNASSDIEAFAARARRAPQSALEEGISLWGRGEGGRAYAVALCIWNRQDPTAAFQYSHSIDDLEIRTDVQVQILARRPASDARTVIQALRALPADRRFIDIAKGVYRSWAKEDAEGAARAALDVSDSNVRISILREITRQWLDADLESAASFIVSIDDRELRQNLALYFSQKIIGGDPVFALNTARDADADDTLKVSTQYVRNIVYKDPEAVFDSVRSRSVVKEQNLLMDIFVKALTSRDTEMAVRFVDRLPSGEKDIFYEYVGKSWARSDPEAAIAWLQKAASPASWAALANIGPVIAHYDVAMAQQLIGRVPKDAQYRWINSITEILAAYDPGQAATWLRDYSRHPAYSSVVELQVSRILETNIEAGVEVILSVPFVEKRSKLAMRYISYVAPRKPATAALLISEAATESTEQRMTSVLMKEWARIESRTAKSWIENMPVSQSRDTAILSFARFSADAPESMTLLCSTIENEHKRKLQIANLITIARIDNIDNILDILSNTSLPDDEKQWYRAHARDVEKFRRVE